MSQSSACKCASCVACTCPNSRHRCDTKAALRQAALLRESQQPQRAHYDPATTKSVTAADYRAPTAAELRSARASRAAKPEWAHAHAGLRPPGEGARFEGTSVTHDAFRGAQNPRPSSARPSWDRGEDPMQSSRPPSLPFEATSSYRDTFARPSIEEARNAQRFPSDRHQRAHYGVLPPGQRFDDMTTSRREFRPHDLAQARPQSAAPAARPPPPPSAPFTAVSQTKADFGPKQRDPSQPLGHYNPHPSKSLQGQQVWLASAGSGLKFEATSTTRDTFQGKQLPPRQSMAPPPEQARPSVPFEGQSQTQAAFRAYDAPTLREASRRRTGDAHASSYRTPSELHNASSSRPRGEYETETRRQFVDKTPAPCPAAAWETPVPTPGTRTPLTY